jgi:hypothetical protein
MSRAMERRKRAKSYTHTSDLGCGEVRHVDSCGCADD